MLFGVVLAITWLILLLRYPTRALPLSLAALAGLATLAGLLLWQDTRHNARLESLAITLRHDRQQCPAERPLHISLHNPRHNAWTGWTGRSKPGCPASRSTWYKCATTTRATACPSHC